MPYVERINGRVVGRYANAQPGYAEEFLPDNHTDLQPSAEELAQQQAQQQAKLALEQLRLDATATAMFTALENSSLAQINTWVDNNFGGMNATQRAFLKLLAASAGMYLREK